MRHFALIGDPVAHSRSPEIYKELFAAHRIEADFTLLRVAPEELNNIRSLTSELSGFAVTMPHKKSIMNYLDFIDDKARECGAVNIVEKRKGELIGHNTDGDGLADALRLEGIRLDGSRAYILGRGGAALSAAHALIHNGCDTALLVRNGKTEGVKSELIDSPHERCDIFINATPLGMKDREDFKYFDLIKETEPSVIFDMVYLPEGKTKLIEYAEDKGVKALDGYRMLYIQALRAFSIFTGIEA